MLTLAKLLGVSLEWLLTGEPTDGGLTHDTAQQLHQVQTVMESELDRLHTRLRDLLARSHREHA